MRHAAISAPRRARCRVYHRSYERRHPYQHHAPGNARRAGPAGSRAGTAHRTHPHARPGRQRLSRQGGAGAAGDAVGVHRHRPRTRRLPARGRHLGSAPARRPGGGADRDRKDPVRRPGADGAGDQGPDRHQGRAPVDPDLDRRPHAGVPAAGQPHRHLAENRKGIGPRPAAQPAPKPAAAGRKRRLHRAHHGRGSAGHRPRGRRRLPAQDLERDLPRRAHPPRHQPAVPGPEPGPARAARLRARRDGQHPGRLARELRQPGRIRQGLHAERGARACSTTPASARCSTCTASKKKSCARWAGASTSSRAAT